MRKGQPNVSDLVEAGTCEENKEGRGAVYITCLIHVITGTMRVITGVFFFVCLRSGDLITCVS